MKFLKKKEFNDENLNKGATSAIDFDIIYDFRFFDISIVLAILVPLFQICRKLRWTRMRCREFIARVGNFVNNKSCVCDLVSCDFFLWIFLQDAPSPIALEPCCGNRAAVLSLLVRLPTGGEPYTPAGQSAGLAVASALVTLGSPRRPSQELTTKEPTKTRKSASQHPDSTCI